jgi:hypothetical protein
MKPDGPSDELEEVEMELGMDKKDDADRAGKQIQQAADALNECTCARAYYNRRTCILNVNPIEVDYAACVVRHVASCRCLDV